ncbi:MAG: hypothetical protein LBV61_00630, partial [Burkholderiaceae bacterium]|jgi:hypothetical protein|nr:hypothetical protein [Burkholderiaceae bacterium]
MWEFIRRYMDEGPQAVADHPMARYVSLSVTPTIKNCMLFAMNYTGAYTPLKRVLFWPFLWLFTLVRWLIFYTCKKPVFPEEIEATCKVDEDDPNIWPIPASAGQFAQEIPGVLEYAEARAKRSWEREQKGFNRNAGK